MSLKIVINFAILFSLISCMGDIGEINPVRKRFIESLSGDLNIPPNISAGNQFSFSVCGDVHLSGEGSDIFKKILTDSYNSGDNFFIVVGDLVNWGKASQYNKFKNQIEFFPFPNGYFTVIGNHDIFGSGWSEYKKLFGPSVYTFASENSRFIVLDNANGTFGKEQLDWLEDVLKYNDKKNVFVFSHLGIFTGTFSSFFKIDSQEETYKLVNLFRKYRVSYMVSGHFHIYLKKEIAGTFFMITGGGGKRPGSAHYVRFDVSDSGIKTTKIEI